jgi:hypothetical protein
VFLGFETVQWWGIGADSPIFLVALVLVGFVVGGLLTTLAFQWESLVMILRSTFSWIVILWPSLPLYIGFHSDMNTSKRIP